MAQIINSNIASIIAQRNLTNTQNQLNTAVERLSSGKRVNSARDDAAGLAIAERMHAQSRGMAVAIRNANDGISMAQVAEGGLQEIGNMLQRMRELAVQSINDTNGSSDRDNLHQEFDLLNNEVNRIKSTTQFNNIEVIGADVGTYTFQIGANALETSDVTTTAITALNEDIGSGGDPGAAIDSIDSVLDEVTGLRAELGAAQSRFSSAINNLRVGMESQSAARSRIVDADYSVETSRLTRSQILQQAGVAMVAQANAQPRNVLSLIG